MATVDPAAAQAGHRPQRFGAAFYTNRASWPALREAVVAAERAGFDSVWLDDHLLTDEGAWDDAKLESWTALAALATLTERVSLGLLVGANTLRNPGLTAKLATTIDQLTGGRAILGLGAGWFEREHLAFGIKFGTWIGERLDRLDESAGLIRRLLDGERVTHDGRFYRFDEALVRPRPVQPRLPILIGGMGRRKTLGIVARHADLWNAYGSTAELTEARDALDVACHEIGRDPATIERTLNREVAIRSSRDAAVDAFEVIRRRHSLPPSRVLVAGGTPAAVAAVTATDATIGFRHPIWIFRDPFDLETIGRLPEIRAALAERDDAPAGTD
ncbi:MAG TPA: LLM class flavin-dependent oxidoreductase [Patescibacteria group bacterium]|nr:LLM class flavin-dependent oxidoreductase [Patescibacteria group bacterium]